MSNQKVTRCKEACGKATKFSLSRREEKCPKCRDKAQPAKKRGSTAQKKGPAKSQGTSSDSSKESTCDEDGASERTPSIADDVIQADEIET